jgi:fructose-1,6-bisphosphatase/inositol monophosphatase family enzyme
MIDSSTAAEIERVIRSVVATEVLPRFGSLAAGDISEKAPGDLVTTADRAAEAALSEQLTKIVPGSVVVGEESVAADASLLTRLREPAPVWIIDPIDGTTNFVNGSPRFASLVALSVQGELVASWTYVPILHTMATAVHQQGAFINGNRLRVRAGSDGLNHLAVSTSQQTWWKPAMHRGMNALCAQGIALCFFDTSGLEYLELAAGRRDVAILTWEYPWDHAAGVLLLREAGGVAVAADGSPFDITGGNALPFIAASNADLAAAVVDAMRAT